MKSGPFAALSVRKTRGVRVLIHTPALILTPNALFLRAVRTGRVFGAHFGALPLLHRVRRCVRQQSGIGAFRHFVFPPARPLRNARVASMELLARGARIVRTLLQRYQLRFFSAVVFVRAVLSAPDATAGRLHTTSAIFELLAFLFLVYQSLRHQGPAALGAPADDVVQFRGDGARQFFDVDALGNARIPYAFHPRVRTQAGRFG